MVWTRYWLKMFIWAGLGPQRNQNEFYIGILIQNHTDYIELVNNFTILFAMCFMYGTHVVTVTIFL